MMTEVGAYRPHINREEWLLAMWETFLLSRHNAFVLQNAAYNCCLAVLLMHLCVQETETSYGLVAQLVRAPPCHGGGRGFDPHQDRQENHGLH